MLNKIKLVIFLGAACSLAVEESYSSFSPTFSVTDHFIFSNQKNDLDPSQLDNHFMHEDFINFTYGNYSADIQFTNLYLPGNSASTRPLVLEKATATAEFRDWTIVGGDSVQEFGRGIALSLYRDDVFGVNHTLQGLSVEYRNDGSTMKMIGGRVHTLQSPVSLNPLPDPLQNERDIWLVGGRLDVDLGKQTTAGAHYLMALQDPKVELLKPFDKTWYTLGGSLSNVGVIEDVDIYLESNILLQNRLNLAGTFDRRDNGMGSYAAISWSPAPWQVKWELKDYRNYNFEFRRPPTLEHALVETTHSEDSFGSRWAVKHKDIESRTEFNSSYLYGFDRVENSPVHHVVGGTKFVGPMASQLELEGGYRSLPGIQNLVHAAIKGKIKTFAAQSLELTYAKQFANKNLDFMPTAENKNLFGASYSFSPKFSVIMGYENVPTNVASIGTNFVNFGTAFQVGALAAKLFAGQTSGGTQCSGGVCRTVPPYSGVMAETTYTF